MRRKPLFEFSRAAFTLVEVVLVFLLAILLLHCSLSILSLSRERFSHHEEATICSTEALFILAQLRRDFEYCFAQSATNSSTPFEAYEKCIASSEGAFEFNVLTDGASETIKYSYDSDLGELHRMGQGRLSNVGQERLAEFKFEIKFLLDDGQICSLSSPEFVSAKASAVNNICRQWIEIEMLMKGKATTKIPVEQVYSFRIFPHLLNKQIRSIWKN